MQKFGIFNLIFVYLSQDQFLQIIVKKFKENFQAHISKMW